MSVLKQLVTCNRLGIKNQLSTETDISEPYNKIDLTSKFDIIPESVKGYCKVVTDSVWGEHTGESHVRKKMKFDEHESFNEKVTE